MAAVLAARADPLDVLGSSARVLRTAHFVRLDRKRIQTVARVLALSPLPVPAWNYTYHFFDGTERTVVYLFLLDALNFSFWGNPRWTVSGVGAHLDGYWALAFALKRAAEQEPSLLQADTLAALSPDELAHILEGEGEIPMLVQRWRNVQELGRVLRDHHGGSAARLVEAAHGDAPALAHLVADQFSSFHDTTMHEGRPVSFFKRAQIVAADLFGAFGGESWGRFHNLQDLTAFADYKLPQILRAWGILRYAPALAGRVDRKASLLPDSREEIEIRAGTLWAVELLRAALAERGRVLTSVQMDWFLWESSQGTVKGIKPYHRVRTIYY